MAYNGSRYRGWQRQPKVISVQEVLEQTLTKMCKQPITCFGCGRTDAEVHASQYFCHIEVEQEWDFDPVFRLNKMLPHDIVVFEIIEAEAGAHARYDANQRTYHYFIHGDKDPFLQSLSAYYELQYLDMERMKAACQLLLEYEDFRSLCKTPDKHNHTLCDLRKVDLWVSENKERLCFRFTANRFLKGMIRLMVGRLLEVGKTKISVEDFAKIIEKKEPEPLQKSAYPQGLYLAKVEYPYLSLPTESLFVPMLNEGLHFQTV